MLGEKKFNTQANLGNAEIKFNGYFYCKPSENLRNATGAL